MLQCWNVAGTHGRHFREGIVTWECLNGQEAQPSSTTGFPCEQRFRSAVELHRLTSVGNNGLCQNPPRVSRKQSIWYEVNFDFQEYRKQAE